MTSRDLTLHSEHHHLHQLYRIITEVLSGIVSKRFYFEGVCFNDLGFIRLYWYKVIDGKHFILFLT